MFDGALSPRQREALILRARGLRDREIGALMDIKQRPEVNRLIQRGRAAVARMLAACGSEMTVDEVIAFIVRSGSKPATAAHEPLSLASRSGGAEPRCEDGNAGEWRSGSFGRGWGGRGLGDVGPETENRRS